MTALKSKRLGPAYPAETFPFKTIRVWAPSTLKRCADGKWHALPCEGEDKEEVSYHRTREAAERTARSSYSSGYRGILRSGRVEENH